MSHAGHNSGLAKYQILSIIERVERLEEEKDGITEDIREVYAEAKGNGLNVKVLRKIVQLRKMDAKDREEFAAELDLYCSAIGMDSYLL